MSAVSGLRSGPNRRELVIALGSLAAARASAALACHAPGHGACHVGAFVPATGPLSEIGQQAQAGIRAMLDQLRHADPKARGNLEIIIIDSQGNRASANDSLMRVISSDKRPSAIIAADPVMPVEALSELGDRFQTPFISVFSYPPRVSSQWVFCIAPDATQVAAALPVALKAAGARLDQPFNLVYTRFAAPRADAFARAVAEGGGTIGVRIELTNPLDADLTAQMMEARKAAKGSAWVVSVPTPVVALVIKRLHEFQDIVPIVIDGGISNPTAILSSGPSTNVLVLSSFYPDPPNPLAVGVYAGIRQIVNGPAAPAGVLAATATQVLAQAVVTAEEKGDAYGIATRDSLRRVSLAAADLIVPWEGVAFDPETLQNREARVVPLGLRGDRVVVVSPA
jgi:ABC-type branched-subunit amino acid transport system substrate-binding protein